MKKLPLILLLLLISSASFAQETTYFKDEYFKKEVAEKKAKYKRMEVYSGDTIIVRSIRMSDEQILKEEKWMEKRPVGVWMSYYADGKVKSKRDFSQVVYQEDLPEDWEDKIAGDLNCDSCAQAEYPEGLEALYKFIGKNIRYPAESLQSGSSGKVYISFTIDKEGKAKAYCILRGVDPFIDLEAWEIIDELPLWTPAMSGGEVVKSLYNLPINFSLR